MKLLVQSDDYGITRAAAQGILYGIRCGIIRNTGIFTNMPWAEECAEWIRPYMSEIALGIDLNASTGPSLLGCPSLCHEDGVFFTSRENRALDNESNGFDHVVYADVYREFEAQIQKYMELFGKKPDYIHRHAYFTKTTDRAISDLAKKYGCPDSDAVMKTVHTAGMGWVAYGNAADQLNSDLKDYILSDHDHLLDSDYSMLVCHAGYADADLFALSSFSTVRVKDLEAVTSPEVLQWVRDNHVSLVTYMDLQKVFGPLN